MSVCTFCTITSLTQTHNRYVTRPRLHQFNQWSPCMFKWLWQIATNLFFFSCGCICCNVVLFLVLCCCLFTFFTLSVSVVYTCITRYVHKEILNHKHILLILQLYNISLLVLICCVCCWCLYLCFVWNYVIFLW